MEKLRFSLQGPTVSFRILNNVSSTIISGFFKKRNGKSQSGEHTLGVVSTIRQLWFTENFNENYSHCINLKATYYIIKWKNTSKIIFCPCVQVITFPHSTIWSPLPFFKWDPVNFCNFEFYKRIFQRCIIN